MSEVKDGETSICLCCAESTAGEAMSTRRLFLQSAACAMVGVGSLCVTAPFIDAAAREKGAEASGPVEVDLSEIKAGEAKTVMWGQKPVFIRRRTSDQMNAVRSVDISTLKHPETDEARTSASVFQGQSLAEWIVVLGVCPHLGCVPLGQKTGEDKGDFGGWVCPCHASHFDASGRVRKGPSPTNLEVPPYIFLASDRLRIG